ncbi:MAG TPA: hypothetical protein V6C52_05340 [Coleofasciculaceae cyanobacterium]|jgi:hypothetical protein
MKATSGFPSWFQQLIREPKPSKLQHLAPRQETSWETVYRPLGGGKTEATDLFVSWKIREQFRENAVRFLTAGKKGYDGYLVYLNTERESTSPTRFYKTGQLDDLPCMTSGPEISITPLFETQNDVMQDSGMTSLSYQIMPELERLTITENNGQKRQYTHLRQSSQEPLLFPEVNQFALRHVQNMRKAENPKKNEFLRLTKLPDVQTTPEKPKDTDIGKTKTDDTP